MKQEEKTEIGQIKNVFLPKKSININIQPRKTLFEMHSLRSDRKDFLITSPDVRKREVGELSPQLKNASESSHKHGKKNQLSQILAKITLRSSVGNSSKGMSPRNAEAAKTPNKFEVFDRLASLSYVKSNSRPDDSVFKDSIREGRHLNLRSQFIKTLESDPGYTSPAKMKSYSNVKSKIVIKPKGSSRRHKSPQKSDIQAQNRQKSLASFNNLDQSKELENRLQKRYANFPIQFSTKPPEETTSRNFLESPKNITPKIESLTKLKLTGETSLPLNKSLDVAPELQQNSSGKIDIRSSKILWRIPTYVKAQILKELNEEIADKGSKFLRRRDFNAIPVLIKANKDLRWLKHVMTLNTALVSDFGAQKCIIRDQLLILQDKLDIVKGLLRNDDLRLFVVTHD